MACVHRRTESKGSLDASRNTSPRLQAGEAWSCSAETEASPGGLQEGPVHFLAGPLDDMNQQPPAPHLAAGSTPFPVGTEPR